MRLCGVHCEVQAGACLCIDMTERGQHLHKKDQAEKKMAPGEQNHVLLVTTVWRPQFDVYEIRVHLSRAASQAPV